MKKMKVLLTGCMALAMMMPMAMTGVSALESDPEDKGYNSKTDVSFDDRNIIPDPDNPVNADWGVEIPTTVRLNKDNTEASKGVDISVKMVEMEKDLEITDEEVRVFVASENTYLLKDATKPEQTPAVRDLRYAIEYTQSEGFTANVTVDSKTTGAEDYVHVATFKNALTTAANATVGGKAYLQSTPTRKGDFKDTLTYVVVTKGTATDENAWSTPTLVP